MIDIHSHILCGIDDGSKTIDESISLLEEAKKYGFTDIILTPHYMENCYTSSCSQVNEKLNEVKDKSKKIGINLYQGNEIYVTENIVKLINKKECMSLNKSKYVLFELPMRDFPINLDTIIYLLLENNYIPIIAHPERYKYVQENPNILIDYIEKGVLFQSNFGSVAGIYGSEVKKTIKKLLTHDMVHFLSSDVHKENTIYKLIPEIINNLNKSIGEEKVKELTTTNPLAIIKKETIEIENPKVIKKSFLEFFK